MQISTFTIYCCATSYGTSRSRRDRSKVSMFSALTGRTQKSTAVDEQPEPGQICHSTLSEEMSRKINAGYTACVKRYARSNDVAAQRNCCEDDWYRWRKRFPQKESQVSGERQLNDKVTLRQSKCFTRGYRCGWLLNTRANLCYDQTRQTGRDRWQ